MWNSQYSYGRPRSTNGEGVAGEEIGSGPCSQQLRNKCRYYPPSVIPILSDWKALAWDFQRQERTA
jgi:hypothetical protein